MFQCLDGFEYFSSPLEFLGSNRSDSFEKLLGMRSDLAESPASDVRVDLLPVLTVLLDKLFEEDALSLCPSS